MPSTASKVWTLSQASAWVVFRDLSVVELFAPPNPENWASYLAYPTMRKAGKIGEPLEIITALKAGDLVATGRRSSRGAPREEIPAREWEDVVFDVIGPYRRLENGTKDEPWRDMLVESADVKRLFRGPTEVEGRSRFSKTWFQDRYSKLREAQPSVSINEHIAELQVQFQQETKREPPSRTTIQRYLKGL